MKKIYYIAIIVTLSMGYFYACERENSATPDEEIIDTVIYDSKYLQRDTSRAIGDGYYDFVFLFDQFKGRNGLTLAISDFNYARISLLNTLATITDTAGNHIDTSLVRVHFRNVKQNLGCDDNVSLNEGMMCNISKVISTANDVANNLFTVDRIGVFANGKRSGGSDVSTIFVTGLFDHADSFGCPFYQWAFDGMMQHELGHTYIGYDHILIPANKMGSCTNKCCQEGEYPFLPQHQHLIVISINTRLNQ